MRLLTTRLRLPSPVAAVLVILALFGCVAWWHWPSRSRPRTGSPRRRRLSRVLAGEAGDPASGRSTRCRRCCTAWSRRPPLARRRGGQPVTVQPGGGLLGEVFSGTTLTLSRTFTTIVVLFFLLSSGDRLLRGLVEVMPRFQEKRQVVEIAAEIEQNVSAYLLTITLMNALVGCATGVAMWLCGVANPLLWGTVAFLLNFIPILGPLTGVGIFLARRPGQPRLAVAGLPAAGLYLAIHLVEGETITPMLVANRFTLNPVIVIVSLFFWHFIWGIPGAFLAVPLLATAKIVCDRIEPLRPLGHIMGS